MALFIVAFIFLLASLGQDQSVDASCCGCCGCCCQQPCCCCKPIVIKLPPPPTKICPCCCCCKPCCCCCCCKPCCCCCCKPCCCCCCPCCCGCGGGGGRKKRDVIDIMAKKLSDVLMPHQDALSNMGCNGVPTFNQPPPALCNQIPLNQQGPACQGAGLGSMNGLNFNGPAGLGLHHSFHQLPVIHPGGAGPINNMPMNIHNLPNPNNNFNPNMVNHLGEIDLGMLNGCENGCGGNCGGGSCGPMNGIGPNGMGSNGNCGGGGCGPMNGLGQNSNCVGGCGPMGMNGNGNGCNSGDCMMFGGNGNGNCPPCGPGRRRRRRQIAFPFMDALRKVANDISVTKNATQENETSRSDANGQKMLVLRNNLELVLRQDKQKIDSASSTATAQSNI